MHAKELKWRRNQTPGTKKQTLVIFYFSRPTSLTTVLPGVFMWEVYNEGRLPYENRTNAEVVESLNSGLRLLKPRLAPDAVYLLMEWCWKEVSTRIQPVYGRGSAVIKNYSAAILCMIYTFLSCYYLQKPEDRPSFALLFHELASILDLWIKAFRFITVKIVFMLYLLIWYCLYNLSEIFMMLF